MGFVAIVRYAPLPVQLHGFIAINVHSVVLSACTVLPSLTLLSVLALSCTVVGGLLFVRGAMPMSPFPHAPLPILTLSYTVVRSLCVTLVPECPWCSGSVLHRGSCWVHVQLYMLLLSASDSSLFLHVLASRFRSSLHQLWFGCAHFINVRHIATTLSFCACLNCTVSSSYVDWVVPYIFALPSSVFSHQPMHPRISGLVFSRSYRHACACKFTPPMSTPMFFQAIVPSRTALVMHGTR
jgi:hypothetical protein